MKFRSPHLIVLSAIITLACIASLGLCILFFIYQTHENEFRSMELQIAMTRTYLDAVYGIDEEIFPRMELPASELVDRPPADLSTLQEQRLTALRRRIEEKYGVTINMYNPDPLLKAYGVHATPYPPSTLEMHLKALNAWMRKYPPQFIHRSGLKTIYLFREWEKDGIETGGFLLERSTIGLQASEEVFHHELFHVMDMTDGGIRSENYDWSNAKFGGTGSALNNRTGMLALGQGDNLQERPYGYVSAYAKYAGVDEDQASTAAELMMHGDRVAAMAMEERPLANAVAYLRAFFFARSEGRMDSRFWDDLVHGNVGDDTYWIKREQEENFFSTPELENDRAEEEEGIAARKLARDDRFTEAEELYLGLIRKHPESTGRIHELGRQYEDRGMRERAIALYEEGLRTHPDMLFHLRLAELYRRQKNYEQSVSHYTAAKEKLYLTQWEMQDFRNTSSLLILHLREQGRTAEAAKAEREMASHFGKSQDVIMEKVD